MYLAGPRAVTPFIIPQLNMEVHTLEGLSLELWRQGAAIGGVLAEEKLIDWVEKDLGMTDLADGLKKSLNQGKPMIERLQMILSETPYGRSLDEEAFCIRMAEAFDQPLQAVHLRQLGNAAYRDGDYRKALSHYRQALSVGYDAGTDSNMGLVYMALGDTRKALECFGRCIDREDGLTYRLNRVKVLMLLETYDQALEDLMHANSLYEDARIWYYYGKIYQSMDRHEEAMAAFGRAAEEGHRKSLVSFVGLAHQTNADGLIEAWLKSHPLPAWLRLRVHGEVALTRGNEERYGLLMEQAFDAANAKGRAWIAQDLVEFSVGKGQVIKGLSYLQYLMAKDAVSQERIGLYRTMMASAAGNSEAFQKEVTSMIKHWKGEARRAAIR